MTKDEALKLALEALETLERQEFYYKTPADILDCLNAITAIKEALAQPEQEPVAWAHKESMEAIKNFDATIYANGGFDDAVALYTTPPQRKPLTDEQARSEFEAWHKDAYTQSLERYGHTYKNHHTRCRFQGWLAAHGIKGEA